MTQRALHINADLISGHFWGNCHQQSFQHTRSHTLLTGWDSHPTTTVCDYFDTWSLGTSSPVRDTWSRKYELWPAWERGEWHYVIHAHTKHGGWQKAQWYWESQRPIWVSPFEHWHWDRILCIGCVWKVSGASPKSSKGNQTGKPLTFFDLPTAKAVSSWQNSPPGNCSTAGSMPAICERSEYAAKHVLSRHDHCQCWEALTAMYTGHLICCFWHISFAADALCSGSFLTLRPHFVNTLLIGNRCYCIGWIVKTHLSLAQGHQFTGRHVLPTYSRDIVATDIFNVLRRNGEEYFYRRKDRTRLTCFSYPRWLAPCNHRRAGRARLGP